MATDTIMAPRVIMLKAGWFEYRWRQTGEQQLSGLADETAPATYERIRRAVNSVMLNAQADVS